MFNLKSPRSRKASSRHKDLESEMATAVREACDAASADMAREKWLELELERQRQLADASSEQLACAEKDKQQLRVKIKQLEATLGQHETYAKLEAQGAQHVEMEMRKMRLQLKEKQLEARALQQELEEAKQQIKEDERAGAALGAATSAAMESHRKLLRQLFALVVRGSLAVQSLNAAMNQGPEGHAYYPAGIQQCMEVLESLIAMRHTCAELLQAGGMHAESLAELTRAATEAAAKSAAATAQSRSAPMPPMPWQGGYSGGSGSAPAPAPVGAPMPMPGPGRPMGREYQPQTAPSPTRGYQQPMASVPETYAYTPTPARTYQQPPPCYGYPGGSPAPSCAPPLSPGRSSYQQQGYEPEPDYRDSRDPMKAAAGPTAGHPHAHGSDSCNGRMQHTEYRGSVDCGYAGSQKGGSSRSERHFSSSASDSLYSGVQSHAATYFSSRHEGVTSGSRSPAGMSQRSAGLEALKAAAQLRQGITAARRYNESPHAERTGGEHGSEISYKSAHTYDDGQGSYGVRSTGAMSQVQHEVATPIGGIRRSLSGRKWFW